MSERPVTYRDLPPDLQAVWREVYASRVTVAASLMEDVVRRSADRAEESALEAVRRANGGELPSVPARDIVVEGVEMARAKLERFLIEEALRLDVGPPRLMAAVGALDAFEARHGRRP